MAKRAGKIENHSSGSPSRGLVAKGAQYLDIDAADGSPLTATSAQGGAPAMGERDKGLRAASKFAARVASLGRRRVAMMT